MTALRFAARTDVGLLRDGNEDSLYAGPRLLAVADGMGGAAAGEVASAVAIAALAPLDEDPPGSDLLDALSNAAYEANDQLRSMIAQDRSLYGMGTTLTAMLIAGTRIGLLHIGDSRAYLLRDGVLTQITHDHTLVQTFVDEGRITREEATTHPQRALILRALKGDEHLDLDLSVRDTLPGDRYLLCSDGLSAVVSDATLLETLLLPDPQQAVDRHDRPGPARRRARQHHLHRRRGARRAGRRQRPGGRGRRRLRVHADRPAPAGHTRVPGVADDRARQDRSARRSAPMPRPTRPASNAGR